MRRPYMDLGHLARIRDAFLREKVLRNHCPDWYLNVKTAEIIEDVPKNPENWIEIPKIHPEEMALIFEEWRYSPRGGTSSGYWLKVESPFEFQALAFSWSDYLNRIGDKKAVAWLTMVFEDNACDGSE